MSYFEFSLVHCSVYVCCDWLQYSNENRSNYIHVIQEFFTESQHFPFVGVLRCKLMESQVQFLSSEKISADSGNKRRKFTQISESKMENFDYYNLNCYLSARSVKYFHVVFCTFMFQINSVISGEIHVVKYFYCQDFVLYIRVY